MSTAVIWFRQDLRLSDNPALISACDYDHLIPIYIDDTKTKSQLGEASHAWLYHSLEDLQRQFHQVDNTLLLFQGDPALIIEQITHELDIDAVLWNRCYDPESIDRDSHIKASLKAQDIHASSFNASLLYEPWQILKKDETPYRVFTPYWKEMSHRGLNLAPLAAPETIPASPDLQNLASLSTAVTLDELELLPTKPWPTHMLKHWSVGEAAAQQALGDFLDHSGAVDYQNTRDLPATSGTSRLSPHLHFGEISPRQIVWKTLRERPLGEIDNGTLTFIKEVVWREFAHYIMYHFPETQQQAMYPQFQNFPWRSDIAEPLERWQKGQTGFPIIDAGMRELWATGWMHNRVRMIVASFLTKNLLINWQEGEAWFRDTLVDADLASNIMGWQWASGCGADAAPYFRIFNPLLQSEKFDKQGEYIRRWVPELAALDNKLIHKPWTAPEATKAMLDYPEPMVDLSASRQRALDAYSKIKKSNKSDASQ